ncbi:fumarylacetoacetate hydrolase family protein [Burkholderia sp. LMG 21824]
MHEASMSDMIFDVETRVVLPSDVMRLPAGNVIVTGMPAGIGKARNRNSG